jgi:hypothetical protein
MRKKGPLIAIPLFGLMLYALVCIVFSQEPAQSPQWGYAVNHELKLVGMILMADESKVYWDDGLPPGWAWQQESTPPDKEYLFLDMIVPEKEEGDIVLEISKRNFLTMSLGIGLSEESVLERFRALQAAPEIRFKEDKVLMLDIDDFYAISQTQAEKLLNSVAEFIDFSNAATGFLIIKTSGQRILKVVIENTLSCSLISFVEISAGSHPDPAVEKEVILKGLRETWAHDFDSDGRDDLRWIPGEINAATGFLSPHGKISLFKYIPMSIPISCFKIFL